MTTPARIIVTGSRDWDCRDVAAEICQRLKVRYKDPIIIHGGYGGVDAAFAVEAKRAGLKTEAFYANWDRLRKRAGPVRNEIMIRHGADLVIAVHQSLEESRGTKDCVCRALQAGIAAVVVDSSPVKPVSLSLRDQERLDCHECLLVTDELITLAEDWSKPEPAPPASEENHGSSPEPAPASELPPAQSEGLTQEQEDRIQVEGAGREVELLVDSVEPPSTFWRWMGAEITKANEEFAKTFGSELGADPKVAVKSVVYMTRKLGLHEEDPDKKRSLLQWANLVNSLSKKPETRAWMEGQTQAYINIVRETVSARVKKELREEHGA